MNHPRTNRATNQHPKTIPFEAPVVRFEKVELGVWGRCQEGQSYLQVLGDLEPQGKTQLLKQPRHQNTSRLIAALAPRSRGFHGHHVENIPYSYRIPIQMSKTKLHEGP